MTRTLGTPFLVGKLRLPAGRTQILNVSGGALPPAGPSTPSRLSPSDWSLTDAGTGGTLLLTLLVAADGRGSPITGYAWRIDDGPWLDLGLTSPGTVEIEGLTDGDPVGVSLRAVNAAGAGLASATQTATPTGGAPTFDISGEAGGIAIMSRPDLVPPLVTGGTLSIQITG
ncbi:hypothetical protein [Jannaschia pohangensis]|uniref:Titin n=1 Tax=Jannaschia pohangensis TaxID=390807 RepID=A0A1I3QUP8_9RHOB|nr:hypothetical protein [Jannaschia pohangensis]SFJ36846.1 titin [Jannaschia pohangensis]